jgi:hypothetical protein
VYGMMYGMNKTTVYLTDELRTRLGLLAKRLGRSEAELIRDALAAHFRTLTPPVAKLPLFKSGQPHLAERVDEELVGFGDR